MMKSIICGVIVFVIGIIAGGLRCRYGRIQKNSSGHQP